MTVYTVKSCYLHSRILFPARALRAYPFCTFSTLFLYLLRRTSPTAQPYSTTLLTISAAHDQLEHTRILILPAVYALPITQSSSFLPVLTPWPRSRFQPSPASSITATMASSIPALPTSQFQSKEEAIAYAQNHGRKNGYALTIKQSIPQLQQIYYCCDRGSYQPRRSKPLMPIPDHLRKRMRSLRQTGCEYTVFIRYSKKQNTWIVSESKNHNHAATEDPDEHPVHRRLQPTETSS